jgi:hypothetical protein
MAVSFTESAKSHLAVLHSDYNDHSDYSDDSDYSDGGVVVSQMPENGRAALALSARKMFLSLNALGFLFDFPFSRRGGSLAGVHSHEEIAGEAGNEFEGTHFAVRVYDGYAVGDHVICRLACNGKGIDG